MELEIFSSRQFPGWLAQQNISLALTTYQTGQLIFLGVNPSGQLSGFQRLYDRAMGLYATPEKLYLSCKSQLWQLDNALEPGTLHKGYDKLYIPRIGHTTGDLDIHDLALNREGRIIFVSSLLNCLATTSDRKSCKPLWKPDFISRIINEDRCHLNGMAMVDGRPGYVTACSQSDIVDGWRDRRNGGGIVIEVASNEIVCTGLTMPHSPRWYQGKLWLHNSGRGELGYVDFQTGKFEAVAFCPGYLRGLAFWGNYAIVGLSKPRSGDKTFSGLPLDELLAAKDAEARCGLMIVDLNTGAIANWVRFEGKITELYDVQILPQAKRPMALGFQTDEIAQLISLEPLEIVSNNVSLPKNNHSSKAKQQQRLTLPKSSQSLKLNPNKEQLSYKELLDRSRILKKEDRLQEATINLRKALGLLINLEWNSPSRSEKPIIWLASYPRSGNTLLRTILWHCFGLPSGSIYPNDLGDNQELLQEVGHIEHSQDGKLHFPPNSLRLLKTHEYPTGAEPAIYIVRNGYAASASLHKFKQHTQSLETIITGQNEFGTWSDHLNAWQPWQRPNTLLLKYEEIIANFGDVLEKLSKFLQRDILKRKFPNRDSLSKIDGRWISSKTDWQNYMSETEVRLFEQINGQMTKNMALGFQSKKVANSINNRESVDNHKKMQFLFLIGVEGTGHHMIRAILDPYFKQDNFVDQGKWHELLLDYWDAAKRFQLEKTKAQSSQIKNIHEKLKTIFQDYRSQQVTHLFESVSFPYYQPRQAIRRPDIIDFAELVKDFVEVKYLLLYRNPVSAAYSAIRRGFTDNVYLQAKIVESNLIYIEQQFSQLPKTSYKILHFEEFLDKPVLYSEQLADWWNLDRETVVKGLENFRQPLSYSQIPTKEKDILEKFFSQKRINQWQCFYKSNNVSPVAQDNQKLLVISQHHDGGFFSNFNKVLHLLERYDKGYDFKVDWTFKGSEAAFRYGDVIGENIWDIFFEALPCQEDSVYDEKQVIDRYLDYSITHVNAHNLYLHQNFYKVRNLYHDIYQKYIKIKPDILEEVNQFFDNHLAGNLCLGVHKRHWLHQTEEYSQKALVAKDYIELIKQLIAKTRASKIFLATDETETVSEIKKAFGDILICRQDITRASISESREMHWQAKNSGSSLGREVLIDALILAKCDFMLHGVSNISTAISFINPDIEMFYAFVGNQGKIQILSTASSSNIQLEGISSSQENLPQKLEIQESRKTLVFKNNSPNSPQALLARSRVLKKEGNLEQAEICLRQAIQIAPDCWGAYNNLGTLLQNQGKISEAKVCYQKAIACNSNFAQAISNLASIEQLEENWDKAKNGYYKALQLNPDYVPAHFNLANIFKEQKRLGGAIEHFEKVIALDPDYTEAYISLGNIFEYQDKLEKALHCYQKALEISPSLTYLNFNIAMVKLRSCDWHNYEQNLAQLLQLLDGYQQQGSFPGVNTFALSALPVSLPMHLSAAQSQAQTISNQVKTHLSFKHDEHQPQKLRIGFISPDFREHAVGRLIHKIFPYFDLDRFDIYAYSTVDVDDQITQAVRSGCDVFVNLANLSTIAAAQRIYDDGIHVMIDLAGYTIGHGAAILALQPAPVQAQWLGYPDTMGAEFMQYYLGDRTLITDEMAEHYTEEIIYLPHTFVASPLKISEKVMTRAEFGLPDDAFVFCCFNSHYKITPELFDLWLRILEQVPNSVLWLASGGGKDNLRLEAKRRGLDEDRLIFAEKIPHDEYLARYALADLYLDTFIYNAGSTAAAVLWTGLPMLTCPGQTNASRMGASICRAGGLEWAICHSSEDYEQRAVHLATHPDELAQIREQLRSQLQSEATYPPLFDVVGFVRSLEAAFEQMWENQKSRVKSQESKVKLTSSKK
ncbi:MAG: TIGR03032 family protein [Cyanobacteria bacterium P01_F01_bin.143]